jgi:hypothetical protein
MNGIFFIAGLEVCLLFKPFHEWGPAELISMRRQGETENDIELFGQNAFILDIIVMPGLSLYRLLFYIDRDFVANYYVQLFFRFGFFFGHSVDLNLKGRRL